MSIKEITLCSSSFLLWIFPILLEYKYYYMYTQVTYISASMYFYLNTNHITVFSQIKTQQLYNNTNEIKLIFVSSSGQRYPT